MSILYKIFGYAVVLFPFILFSQTQNIITGKVVGSDGKPMLMAHVHIDGSLGHIDVLHSFFRDINYYRTQANSNGEFKITTNLKGPFYLAFTGIEHKTLQIPLILTGHTNIKLSVRLAALKYPSNLENVQINYDFDEVSRGKTLGMKHESNGTYSIQIPSHREKIIYRISGIRDDLGQAVPASTYDSFIYDQDIGVYSAVLKTPKNYTKIVFDPSKLQRSQASVEIKFADTNSEEAKLNNYYFRLQSFQKIYDEELKHCLASGGTFSKFTFNYKPLLKKLYNDLDSEKNPLLRQELILECLELTSMSNSRDYPSWLQKLARQIPTSSPVWAYHGNLPLEIASIYPDSAVFIQRMITNPPCRTYAALILYRLCSYAKEEGHQKLYKNLYYRLISEYNDTPPANTAKSMLNSDENIRVGSLIPNFSFTSVDNFKIKFTNRSFRNKFVLIDFWATWCSPCVGEIKFLDKAYQRFKKSGLEILSVSFDTSSRIVQVFRKTRYAMPWKNVYVESNKQADITAIFDVSFPKLILLNREGRIVEMGDNLRGDQLEKTLLKYIQPSR